MWLATIQEQRNRGTSRTMYLDGNTIWAKLSLTMSTEMFKTESRARTPWQRLGSFRIEWVE